MFLTGLWKNETRYGFDVMDILSGEKALSMSHLQSADVVFIDEVGFLELDDKGWASSLDILMREWRKPHYFN